MARVPLRTWACSSDVCCISQQCSCYRLTPTPVHVLQNLAHRYPWAEKLGVQQVAIGGIGATPARVSSSPTCRHTRRHRSARSQARPLCTSCPSSFPAPRTSSSADASLCPPCALASIACGARGSCARVFRSFLETTRNPRESTVRYALSCLLQ